MLLIVCRDSKTPPDGPAAQCRQPILIQVAAHLRLARDHYLASFFVTVTCGLSVAL
jgi:hypothetical protein